VLPLRSIAFLLYFVQSSVASFAFPIVGVLCYILLYHVYPQSTWWGKCLEPMGIRYAFVCGLCLLVGSVLNLNRLKFGRQFIHPIELGILLVFLTMMLSIVTGLPWRPDRDFIVDKMSKVFLFAFVLSHVPRARSSTTGWTGLAARTSGPPPAWRFTCSPCSRSWRCFFARKCGG